MVQTEEQDSVEMRLLSLQATTEFKFVSFSLFSFIRGDKLILRKLKAVLDTEVYILEVQSKVEMTVL